MKTRNITLHKMIFSENPGTNCQVLILSAGKSGRMGMEKALLPFDKTRNFLQQIVLSYARTGIERIGVVVNADNFESIEKCIQSIPMPVKMIINKEHPESRFYSIQKGLLKAGQDLPCYIHPVDNPFIASKTLDMLYLGLSDPDHWIRPLYFGKGGHPVLLGTGINRAVIHEGTPNQNFRQFLKSFKMKNVEIADRRILANINGPEEYKAWFNGSNSIFRDLSFDEQA